MKMKEEKKNIKNSDDIIDEIKKECISRNELTYQLKRFPELLNSTELFILCCEKLKLEYIEAFLTAGISVNTIINSGYQQHLITACEKLMAKNTESIEMQKVKFKIVGDMHEQIANAIKTYLDKRTKKSKRI